MRIRTGVGFGLSKVKGRDRDGALKKTGVELRRSPTPTPVLIRTVTLSLLSNASLLLPLSLSAPYPCL